MRFPRAQRPDACATLDGGEWAQFLEEQEQAAKWERERIEQQKPRKIRVVPSEFSQERRTTIEGLLTVNVPRGGDDDTSVVLSPILNGHEMTRERQARLRQGEQTAMCALVLCASSRPHATLADLANAQPGSPILLHDLDGCPRDKILLPPAFLW